MDARRKKDDDGISQCFRGAAFQSNDLVNAPYVVSYSPGSGEFEVAGHEETSEFTEKVWAPTLKPFTSCTHVNLPEYTLPEAEYKQRHWGEKYQRLAGIKNKWDPENIFTCRHCVGAEHSSNFA